ncbi:MAG: SulP family inorganic anion transporter [Bryobacterales bacterium]|nr:SulP family inorganic anion transporter [Bryobacterales bacterium]
MVKFRPASDISIAREILASFVVFLVALPLCMGIAIASGVPPAAGLISGIIGGLVVGFLAGSPLQVSGPAAGLTVLVYQLVQEHGLLYLGVIVGAAGLLQIAAGLGKMGQWFRAISPAVIYGMLGGIGVLILSSQFHVMVDDAPRSSGWRNLFSIPEAIYKGVFPLDGSTHHIAAGIGILSLATLVLWDKFKPRGLKMVPGALVAVVITAIVATRLNLPIRFIEIPSNLFAALQTPTFEAMKAFAVSPMLLFEALAVAFIASAETLLCATAVDQMHNGPRTNYDRELAAQGVGNTIAGAFGALPMTGVIVRSGANVQAGARTRYSAVMHGVWLLALVALFPHLLEMIPTAALAAILVFTGYKLVNVKQIKQLATFGKGEVLIYFVTLGGIVATDLLTGVLLGLGLAVARLLYNFSHLRITAEIDPTRNRVDLRMEGAATFLRLPHFAAALETLPPGSDVHVHFERLNFVDHACIEHLAGWGKQHKSKGGQLVVEWHQLMDRYRREDVATELIVNADNEVRPKQATT